MNFVVKYLEGLTVADVVIVLCLGFLFSRLGYAIYKHYSNLRVIKKTKKELDANRCTDHHKWIDIGFAGKTFTACEKCCWCPTYEDYINRVFVKAEVERRKFDQEFEEYKKEKIIEFCDKYNLRTEEGYEVYDNLIRIKKDFTVRKLDQSLENLRSKE